MHGYLSQSHMLLYTTLPTAALAALQGIHKETWTQGGGGAAVPREQAW